MGSLCDYLGGVDRPGLGVFILFRYMLIIEFHNCFLVSSMLFILL